MSKTILITGTSTGFGKLMAITLAEAGHSVIAGMREPTGKNAGVAAELAALPNVEVKELDVTSDASVSKAFTEVLAKYGQIDVLVNNAGVTGFGLLESYSIDQIRNLFEEDRTSSAGFTLGTSQRIRNGGYQRLLSRDVCYGAV